MNPATLNQIRSERATMQAIKLSSLDGKNALQRCLRNHLHQLQP